jgi:hypothetical protein
LADKKIDADLTTPIGDILAALKRDGERIRVAINGKPIVLTIHRERATDHLTLDQKMKMLQDAFAETDGAPNDELEKFHSPLDYE